MTRSLTDRIEIFNSIMRFVKPHFAAPPVAVDLGCGHCKFTELAKSHGCLVTGIDARMDRVPENVPVLQRRVQDADLEKYNLVLCLGIFYHMELSDQLELVDKLAGKIAIVDTHYGHHQTQLVVRGEYYWGEMYKEGNRPTSSFGNPLSFWPVEPDLVRMLGKRHDVLKWLPEHHPGRSFYVMVPRA